MVIGVIIGVKVLIIINRVKNFVSFFLLKMFLIMVWERIIFVEVVNFCKKCVMIKVVIVGVKV